MNGKANGKLTLLKAPPADPGEARRMINEMREDILRRDQGHGELLEQFFRLAERITQAASARALLEAGFTITHKVFNLPGRVSATWKPPSGGTPNGRKTCSVRSAGSTACTGTG